MSILEIEFVGEQKNDALPQLLADSVGKVLNSPAGQTWIKVRYLSPEFYAENRSRSHTDLPVCICIVEVFAWNR